MLKELFITIAVCRSTEITYYYYNECFKRSLDRKTFKAWFHLRLRITLQFWDLKRVAWTKFDDDSQDSGVIQFFHNPRHRLSYSFNPDYCIKFGSLDLVS